MDRGLVEIIETMWIVVVSAGGVVFALYGLDHWLELERIKAESKQREQLVSEMLKDRIDASK